MADLISKFAFGFFMAQFVPGVLVVLSMTIPFVEPLDKHDAEEAQAESAADDAGENAEGVTFDLRVRLSLPARGKDAHEKAAAKDDEQAGGLFPTLRAAIGLWMQSVELQIVFLALCVGAGMTIHGLHWSVLGFLESFSETKDEHDDDENGGEDEDNGTSIFDYPHHVYIPLIVQILLGPIFLVLEVLALLVFGFSVGDIAITDNAPKVRDGKMAAFTFLEDFYLHFSQFYAHTAIALVFALPPLIFVSVQEGFQRHGLLLCGFVYLLAGLFFVIGRIQLASLFNGEVACTEADSGQEDEVEDEADTAVKAAVRALIKAAAEAVSRAADENEEEHAE